MDGPDFPWVRVEPYAPRSAAARGLWFVARAAVALWEQAVDRAWRGRRR